MADKTSRRSQDPRAPQRRSTSSRRPRGPENTPDASHGPPPFRIGPFSWLILALLIVWNAWAFMPHESAEVPLPYSEFVSQIASGNVTTVRIVGAAITGAFAHPVTWPQPSSKPPSQPSSKSAPQPSSESAPQPGSESAPQPSSESAPQPGSESAPQPSSESAPQPGSDFGLLSTEQATKPQRYARFSTTYPSEVGDPTLI